ncbi:MAG: MBL fold metallo-hydrolase [Candidatus Lokiarchaeota archaeon]|nr:MBL fold metallo-hydrolase [Candidatus Lokiarchaeota archaeon]
MLEKKEVASMADFMNKSNPLLEKKIQLVWLGQAGFALRYSNILILIDPYLSDYLSRKYKGNIFPHIRLMEPPMKPKELTHVDYVFCSHPHSDHMDPETVTPISQNNPHCRFIVPGPEIEEAVTRGIDRDQIIPAYVYQTINLCEDIKIQPIPAKHEEFKINEANEHSYLGYIFQINNQILYHSGDSVPYDQLPQLLKDYDVTIALMPINGRDKYRMDNGIAGNFKIHEVLDLCRNTTIKSLIVHHFGMFAYNTATKEELEYLENLQDPNLEIIIPKINYIYTI